MSAFMPCLVAWFAPWLLLWLLVRKQIRPVRAMVYAAWGLVSLFSVCVLSFIFIQTWAKAMSDHGLLANASIDQVETATSSYGLRPGANIPYRTLIEKYAQQYNVDPVLIGGIIQQESGGDPTAVSSAGAKGLMQIMPNTQGDQCPGADLFDPEQNIACGVKHMKWTLDQFGGDQDRAIMAYHSGVTALKTNGPRPIDQTYLRAVTGYMSSYASDRILIQQSAPAQVYRASIEDFSLLDFLDVPNDGSQDAWGPIYDRASVKQWTHGQSYGHLAIDIAAGYGQPIYSPCNCCITNRYTDEFANPVLVLSNDRWQVILMHGDYFDMPGKCYEIGQPVGKENTHGNSTGPHTHISVLDRQKGYNVNPYNLGLTRG